MDFLLPIWNPFIVHPLMAGLRAFANPLQTVMGSGLAGGLAIIFFTIVIRLVLLPLSLQQVRSQRAMMTVQPELKALQKKFKGDREGMARAQMALYKERGVNPAAGCLPLLVQMPILFGMYAAMLNLSTVGLTLDRVQTQQIEAGRITYAASRTEEPQPTSQFVLASITVVPRAEGPIAFELPADASTVAHEGNALLEATQGLTLNTGQATPNVNPPHTPDGRASVFLRPGGVRQADGTLDRSVPVQVGKPYLVELEINAPRTRVDAANTVVTFDPTLVDVTSIETPPLEDLPFKSSFLWLASLGEPDLIHMMGFGIPGLLIILMTITSYVSQRMMTVPSDDPQQQAMMRSMAFMPLMYLFFFLNTPSGLVLYWLTSNVFSMVQQYFTMGLGLFASDLHRITGKDFQPTWAKPLLPPSNGRVASVEPDGAEESTEKTPAPRRRAEGSQGGPSRAAGGKGRKRGKR